MKELITLIAIVVFFHHGTAQELQGSLKHHAGQSISLIGFSYYDINPLAETTIDSLGNFKMAYPKDYTGLAILQTQDKGRSIVLLDDKQLVLKGTHLNNQDSLQVISGTQHQQFVRIAKATGNNDKAMAAWRYLKKVYKDPYFTNQTSVLHSIDKEIERIERSNKETIENIASDRYLQWYAPLRKLVSDMPQTIQRYTDRIPANIGQFRTIDFTNPNFKTSGIFKELIEGHYFLLENMGQPLDTVYSQMNKTTDYLIHNLKGDTDLLNRVSKKLFRLFEKRSLFKAASHLSEQLLSSDYCDCRLDKSLENTLQKYGALKVGNTAPDIQLTPTKKLSDLDSNILLVFGSSSCPACKKELVELLQYDKGWEEKEIEVVYLSLDTDKESFEAAYKNTPWPVYCDFKGWKTQAAIDYYVNATPTYLLLNKNREILIHPRSLAHVNAWVKARL